MSSIKIPTAFNIDLEFEAADTGKRLLAYVIDSAVRIVYLLAMIFLDSQLLHVENDVLQAIYFGILVAIPFTFYFFLCEWLMGGRTPGKAAVGIKVVSLMGNQPTAGQVALRSLMRFIESPMVFCGAVALIAIARSPYSQRVGDLVAGTIVVDTKAKHSLDQTIFRNIAVDYQPQFFQILKLSDKDLNKVKELLDRAVKQQDFVLAHRVAERVKTVLKIETQMNDMMFLETLLNDYNYLVTRA